MSEYIERGALLKDIKESVVFSVRNAPSAEMRGANKILDRIQCAPAADVVEVKHGVWLYKKCVVFDRTKDLYRCSECKTSWDAESKYCPNCGAKMDGE